MKKYIQVEKLVLQQELKRKGIAGNKFQIHNSKNVSKNFQKEIWQRSNLVVNFRFHISIISFDFFPTLFCLDIFLRALSIPQYFSPTKFHEVRNYSFEI